MLPMIVLPAAALFLSLSQLPWSAIGLPYFNGYLATASDALFSFLPFLFALGVASGLSNNAMAAVMAALAGMFIYTGITGNYSDIPIRPTVLIGVLFGLFSGFCYEKLKELRLPEWLNFFGGPRSVPIVVSGVSVLFSIVMIQIAPLLQSGLEHLGEIVSSTGGFGVFLFGFVLRILVVFGLHHLVSHVFWFQVGGYETAQGVTVYGDLPRFFCRRSDGGRIYGRIISDHDVRAACDCVCYHS